MNKRKTGAEYEKLAAEWLMQHGFQILEYNYRCRQGEIDLIAREGAALVFVEVKYRKNGQTGDPSEAVDIRKQKKISRVALYYCWEKKVPQETPCRFDVISIKGESIRQMKDAFPYIG